MDLVGRFSNPELISRLEVALSAEAEGLTPTRKPARG
jgi:hypothetical protein